MGYSGNFIGHRFLQVLGFECVCPLFRKRRYNVVSPFAYAIGIRRYDQFSRLLVLARFDQEVRREIKNRNENGDV